MMEMLKLLDEVLKRRSSAASLGVTIFAAILFYWLMFPPDWFPTSATQRLTLCLIASVMVTSFPFHVFYFSSWGLRRQQRQIKEMKNAGLISAKKAKEMLDALADAVGQIRGLDAKDVKDVKDVPEETNNIPKKTKRPKRKQAVRKRGR